MSDLENKILDLHKIARNKKVRVLYCILPDQDSFVTLYDGKTYIYLDVRLNDYNELKQFSHEMGHDFGGIKTRETPDWLAEIFETRARNWANTYLVPYEEIKKTFKTTYIRCECEAAEEIGVDVDTFLQSVEYYQSKGLPVKQCEFITDWQQWDY